MENLVGGVEDFINEVHLSFAHIAGAYTEQQDKEIVHLHLIRSHCDVKAKKFIRSLHERQRSKAADLIAALRSAFNTVDGVECREVRAHGAMLGLRQREGEPPAKYARRARRISNHINLKHDSLLAMKFHDGFRSRSLKRHLSIKDSACKTSFGLIYIYGNREV